MADSKPNAYTEADIKSLDWKEHIRRRPGMYIGKLGDGTMSEDGIYILLKEVVDNAVDEYLMGFGKKTEITIDAETGHTQVRDYGRGIPLGKLMDCASKMNTGAKYDSNAFQKSVGLNGVGIKAVNALSSSFTIQAWREGETRLIEFSKGEVVSDKTFKEAKENGTRVTFDVDKSVFPKKVKYKLELVAKMCQYYAYLNPGLGLVLNGKRFYSKNGLLDLLKDEMGEQEPCYDLIHLKGKDIEIVFTHTADSSEDYYSFVNGQNTHQGGTHLQAFREGLVKEVREFYKKQFEPSDVRSGIVAAIAIRIQEPVFESQTKTKLGSSHMAPEGETLRTFIGNFIKQELDNYLYKNTDTAELIHKRILLAERERKELSGVKKLARERARQSKIHNKKLRDCRLHQNTKDGVGKLSTLFITEGDSASGSITKSRDVKTQAVFSLRGKPLNCYGLTKKVVYENEEFALLQAALGIEEGIENLRYERVVISTDADVDGMHIRLLLLTFFLQFFPDLVRDGHLYLLQTPLFRVRNKKKTLYCYDDEEKDAALKELGKASEITRFKGLGEISPDEFGFMIGKDMRLDPVNYFEGRRLREMLAFFMGKNTPDRQVYIMDNLREEIDKVDPTEIASAVEL